MARAAELAGRYRVVLERTADGCVARGMEIPTVVASGATPDECERKVREMLALAVASMLEVGETPPLPAGERRVQVNIRLSEDERWALEEAVQRQGFRGVSEFVRFAALQQARSGR